MLLSSQKWTSREETMAQGSQANACNSSSGEVETGEYQVSLASQSGLLVEFQAVRDPVYENEGGGFKGTALRFSPASMHTNINTHTLSSLTPSLLHSPKHTHKGKKLNQVQGQWKTLFSNPKVDGCRRRY